MSWPRWPTRIACVILMNPRCLVFWTSVCVLARGKDVFAIMPTGFGKSLIFQLFPRLAKAALTLENSTIIVVSPLISIMRDQEETLKKLGFSAAAIGIGKEGEKERRKREKESAKLFSVVRSPGWSQSGNNKTIQRLLSLFKSYYQGRNYALQSKGSHYFKRNTKLEFTRSQCNSPSLM